MIALARRRRPPSLVDVVVALACAGYAFAAVTALATGEVALAVLRTALTGGFWRAWWVARGGGDVWPWLFALAPLQVLTAALSL